METYYEINAKTFKALSDSNRLKIVDILSCGEKCACEILNNFNFTQPTLSHHMKVLIDCGLVNSRKDGTWNYYSLNSKNTNKLVISLMNIVLETEQCVCTNQKE